MFKKGEYEGRAMAVILISLAAFIILYVLLLPPDARDDLLGTNSTYQYDRDGARIDGEFRELLAASPGLVTPEKEFGTSHNIGSINLFLKTEPEIIKLANSLSISKSLISSASPKLNFDLESSTDLDKVNLFFTIANEPEGILKIKINGREFYSEEASRGVRIIPVPITYLQERNTIEMSVSHPGIAFWKKNDYQLQEIGVKEEFERINTKEERRFTISQREKKLLDEAKLTFYQFCNSPLVSDSAELRVLMNDKEIFRGQIRCMSTRHTVSIPTELLTAGNNNLIFTLDEGDFSFNEIDVETKSEGDDFLTYIFQVSHSEYNRIRDGSDDVILELLLDSSTKNKNAVIRVNSGDIFMRTTSENYEADITAFVDQGSNFIRIQPTTSFKINGLKVLIQ